MSNGNLDWITNFIWGIADDVLRDLYQKSKYRDVILPMTVLRRLDTVLEPVKANVRAMKEQLDAAEVIEQDAALRQAAGQAFYNTSAFTLRDLRNRSNQAQLKADFEDYLDGFSPNVQEILESFEFRNQTPKLARADALGGLIEKFVDPQLNLGPNPVLHGDGSVKLPALDNHGMGTIFEALVRKFNEANNDDAGEHWTPRDAVKLMAELIFRPVADQIASGTYLLYDGACGTGGMLTVAEETLERIAHEHGKKVSTHLFGQEISPETYAIAKADLILKLIRAKRQLIALLNEQKQSIIHRAITRGLDPAARLKPSGVDWLGDVPEHWDVAPLKRLVKMQSGETITAAAIDDTGPFPVYGGNGLRGYTSRSTNSGEFILIGRQGALCGNVHLVDGDFFASEHAIVCHPRAAFDALWLAAVMEVMNLNQYSIAAAQPGLSVDRIAGLKVPIPSPDEQRTLTATISQETRETNEAIALTQREIALIQEFRTRLIDDVVTGQLDVRSIAASLPDVVEIEAADNLTDENDLDDADVLIEEDEAA